MKVETNMPFSSLANQDQGQTLKDQGILDKRNLLTFDTLHELQERASVAFADNPLFGTYTENGEGGKEGFEWMDCKKFGEKDNLCRSVLKDLGELV